MATGAKERIATPVLGRQIVTGLIVVLALLAVVWMIALAPNLSGRSVENPEVTNADAARWVAMGEFYVAQTEARQLAQDAMVARYQAMGDFYAAQTEAQAETRQRAWEASKTYYTGMGEFYATQTGARQPATDALVAHWSAIGDFYTAQAEARLRAWEASETYYTGMGEFYAAQATIVD